MLILTSEIIVIKNKKSVGTKDTQPTYSTNFTIPTNVIDELNKDMFKNIYDSGSDVALVFRFVNEIEINAGFKMLTKTCTITLPRRINYGGVAKLMNSANPIFGYGDRIIIRCGYIDNHTGKEVNSIKEIFRGYITNIGLGTPTTIECEDQMFILKHIPALFPTSQSPKGLKIKLSELMKQLLTNNNYLKTEYNVFLFSGAGSGNKEITYGNFIPVVFGIGEADIEFSYRTSQIKSVASILEELKTKLLVYSYFDYYGNLRIELPYFNTDKLFESNTLKYQNFYLGGNIIDDSNLKFKLYEEEQSQIIVTSAPEINVKNKEKQPTLTYIYPTTKKGDFFGRTTTFNLSPGISMTQLEEIAKQAYKAERYTGYDKGSSFETFGEPMVNINEGVRIKNTTYDDKYQQNYDEKEGDFCVAHITRKFGVNGYRQIISLTRKLNK
jgi:hypothetical protein